MEKLHSHILYSLSDFNGNSITSMYLMVKSLFRDFTSEKKFDLYSLLFSLFYLSLLSLSSKSTHLPIGNILICISKANRIKYVQVFSYPLPYKIKNIH